MCDRSALRIICGDSLAWEEVLARIAEEVDEGLAKASDEFKALVTVLPKPVKRSFDKEYSPDVTCWYLARPLDKPDTTFLGYYPYSFPGFVDMIQRELDK